MSLRASVVYDRRAQRCFGIIGTKGATRLSVLVWPVNRTGRELLIADLVSDQPELPAGVETNGTAWRLPAALTLGAPAAGAGLGDVAGWDCTPPSRAPLPGPRTPIGTELGTPLPLRSIVLGNRRTPAASVSPITS
jgi:hypothetical protein